MKALATATAWTESIGHKLMDDVPVEILFGAVNGTTPNNLHRRLFDPTKFQSSTLTFISFRSHTPVGLLGMLSDDYLVFT
jgi:hypothetical protein